MATQTGSYDFKAAKAAHDKLVDDVAQASMPNIALETGAVRTPTTYNALDIYLTEPLVADQQYTLKLWDVDISNSGATADTLQVSLFYCGGNVSFGNWKGTTYFTNGHADSLDVTFTPKASAAATTNRGTAAGNLSHSSVTGAAAKFIRLYNMPSGSYTRNLTVAKWKLVKGGDAGEWSQAPNDGVTEYIVGTQTGTTGSWTGVTNDMMLSPGKTIAYKLPHTGSGNASLNLTLANGTTTGAKDVYSMTTRVNTQYPAASIIQMTYDGTNWRTTGWYNTDTNARYVQYYNTIVAGEDLVAASLIGGRTDGKFYQISGSGDYFDLSRPLLWLTAALAEGATDYSHIYTQTYDRNLGTYYTSFNTGGINKVVYLVGTVDGNTFTVYGSNSSQYLTCNEPTTADGRVYIPIGRLGNQSNGKNYFNFVVSVPVTLFAFADGAFGPVSIRMAAEASKKATNYIADLTNGIMVHPEGNSTTGVKITDKVEIVRSNTSVAEYGSTARIGTTTGGNVKIDSDSVDMCNGTTTLASFGKTAGNVPLLWLGNEEILILGSHTTGTAAKDSLFLYAYGSNNNADAEIRLDARGKNDNQARLDVYGTSGDIQAYGTSLSANQVFCTGTGTSEKIATFRSLAADDLPIVTLAKGGTGASNASVAINKVFAGPGSGSAGNASFRALVAADIPTLAVSKISALVGHAYGTCATAADTAAKAVTCSGFVRAAGSSVAVKFTYSNTHATPTLNVNSTGAAGIRVGNANAVGTGAMWGAGDVVEFIFDGTYWQIQGRHAVLYDNATGSNSSVTLAKAITNYNHLRIFFRETQQSAKSSIDVYSPANGDKVSLIAVGLASDNATYQVNAAPWYFSSTTALRYASTAKNAYINVAGTSSGFGTQAGIYVTRVEAWSE